jgi:dimethylaniline monooxygenase (N-oxide forming)
MAHEERETREMTETAFGPDDEQRTCIIGAGSSGIAVAKELHRRGLPFDCYELGDRVGGNWVFGNSNQVSSSYRSLHINTSRERMEYADFPMPKHYPDFPRHDQIAAYFDDYVNHFGFRDSIRFETGVEHVDPREDGRFDVRLSTGEELVYSHVIVANGHHWDPRWPEPAFPGSEDFEGEQLHAHYYKEESQLAGKDVVVLGVGNSGMDIAVDASYYANRTYLAHRRGAHIIPKYMFGKPIDQIGGSEKLPGPIRFWLMGLLVRMNTGKMEDYGLHKPDHRLGQAHPTISGRILDRLAHGAITPKPNIESLGTDTVRFADGTEVHADLVIYCTGYKITFPFFDPDFISAPDNRIDLYKYVFHPRVDNLYFVGLVQPLGAVMPIAERQSQLIAEHITGAYRLPSRAAMEHDISVKQERMKRRYVASKRHTIQVDYDDYMKELRLELESCDARPARSAPLVAASPSAA